MDEGEGSNPPEMRRFLFSGCAWFVACGLGWLLIWDAGAELDEEDEESVCWKPAGGGGGGSAGESERFKLALVAGCAVVQVSPSWLSGSGLWFSSLLLTLLSVRPRICSASAVLRNIGNIWWLTFTSPLYIKFSSDFISVSCTSLRKMIGWGCLFCRKMFSK